MYRVITAARSTSVQDDVKFLASKLWNFVDGQYSYAQEHNFSLSQLPSKSFRSTIGGKRYIFKLTKGVLEVSSESGQLGRWGFRDGFSSHDMKGIADKVVNDARYDEIDYMDRQIYYWMARSSYGFRQGSLSPNQIISRWVNQAYHLKESGDRDSQYWGFLGRSTTSGSSLLEFVCSDDPNELIEYLDGRVEDLDAKDKSNADKARLSDRFYDNSRFCNCVLDIVNSKEIHHLDTRFKGDTCT